MVVEQSMCDFICIILQLQLIQSEFRVHLINYKWLQQYFCFECQPMLYYSSSFNPKWNVCWSGPPLLWVDIRFSSTFFRANEPSDRSVLIILKVIRWWAVTLLVVPFTFFSVSLGSQLGELQIRCIISSQSRRTIICLMGRILVLLFFSPWHIV